MSAPTRFLSGFTQAASYQPLGHIGVPDPFFYFSHADDFPYWDSGHYTVTAAGGSVASQALAGGHVLFTTGASAGNFASIQLPTASFQYAAGKKLAYLCRVQLGNVTTAALIAGLINTTTAPFTLANITDGIYFNKAAGSTDLVLTVRSGSATIGTATLSGLLTANIDIDLGFYVDRNGNIKIYAGANLEGAQRPNTANLGPDSTLLNSSLTAALSTVLLNATLAVSNGATAAAMTGSADFLFAARER